MVADLRGRILAELAAGEDGGPSASRLCEVSSEFIGVSGSGVMLMSDDKHRGSLCTGNAVSALIEELQFALGEGPGVDAYHCDRVVSEPDLVDPVTPRWLAFGPKAVDCGVRGVFSFPLRVGVIRLGALDLYRDQPGVLNADQLARGLEMAKVITHWVLDVQRDAPSGALADELESGTELHLDVHRAAGAVSVQLGVTIAEAMIRLRSHAFVHDRPLSDVAREVLARTLRFS